MASGKTENAIDKILSFKEPFIVFQPSNNLRDKGFAKSRTGKSLPATRVNPHEDFLKIIAEKSKGYDIIGIEELFFFQKDRKKFIEFILKSSKKKEIVLPLPDYYFNGESIELLELLRPYSIVHTGESGLCEECGCLATRSQRLYKGKPEFFDAEKVVPESPKGTKSPFSYFPVCFKHWQVLPPKEDRLYPKYIKNYLNIKNLKFS